MVSLVHNFKKRSGSGILMHTWGLLQAKRELLLKEWEALDQKGKEQLFVLQTEANNKRIMREEQQDSVLQKIVWNTEYNIKIVQQEHQRKVQHDKVKHMLLFH